MAELPPLVWAQWTPLVYVPQVFKQVFRFGKVLKPAVAKLPPLVLRNESIKRAHCAALLATPPECFQLLFRGDLLLVPLLNLP
jgi:hypothetical protein